MRFLSAWRQSTWGEFLCLQFTLDQLRVLLLPNMSKDLAPGSASISSQVFDQAVANDKSDYRTLGSLEGSINPYALHEELGALMTKNVTVVRNNKDLAQTLSELDNIEEKYHQIGVQDHASWSNTVIPFVRQLEA